MNLSNIPAAPHAQGFIKVAMEGDPAFGDRRTVNDFLITSRHHTLPETGEPRLNEHPIKQKLLGSTAESQGSEPRQLREIPIRLFFNKPENALSIRYQAYAASGNAPVCAGDGKNAKRLVLAGDDTPTLQDVPCTGPETCPFVQSGEAKCNRQVRMAVQIVEQGDPLSVFEVRTSSLNTYRALRGQLQYIHGRFKGLRHVPLKLTLWQASNEASGYQPFTLMQLALDATSELEAMQKAKATRNELAEAGIDDDVDAALGSAAGADDEIFAAADFQSVAEFYGGAASRRVGTQAITPQTMPARRSQGELGTAATNAFSTAVKMAAPAQHEVAAQT